MALDRDTLMAKNAGDFEEVIIARQLSYPERVIRLLSKESSETRRINILHDARLGKYN